MTRSRLAAGALGPSSTFRTRRGQKHRSAAAIIAACRAVLDEDGVCPSITNVVAAGTGFSETTLNRDRYKPILHAAKRRFAARAAGEWTEGDVDQLARMEEAVAQGIWVVPAELPDLVEGAADADDVEDAAAGGDAEGGGDAPPHPEGIEGEGVSPDVAALAEEMTGLAAQVARLEAEVARRDDQLYHAIQTAQLWSRTIRNLRGVIRELRSEIDSIQTEPWNPREQGEWTDGDDEDWPEHE